MLEVARLQPKSIIELGSGWGAYALLCRQLLDIEPGRLDRKDWQTQIVGVEGFIQYRNPVHDYAYTEMRYEDFTKHSYAGYDLALMVDSLEHVEKSVGHKLLDDLLTLNKHVIVSCPYGQNYLPQGDVHGNPFERHRAHWLPEDFEVRGGRILSTDICVVASIRGQKGNPWRR